MMDDKTARAWVVYIPHNKEVLGYRSTLSEALYLRDDHNRIALTGSGAVVERTKEFEGRR